MKTKLAREILRFSFLAFVLVLLAVFLLLLRSNAEAQNPVSGKPAAEVLADEALLYLVEAPYGAGSDRRISGRYLRRAIRHDPAGYVVVSKDGECPFASDEYCFRSVAEAVRWIAATRAPSRIGNPWDVRVHPGWYSERPFTVPDGVTVSGLHARGLGNVVGSVDIANAEALAGDFITLDGGSLANLAVRAGGIPAPAQADSTLVRIIRSHSTLFNVEVSDFASFGSAHTVTPVVSTAPFAYLQLCVIQAGPGQTALRGEGSGGFSIWNSFVRGNGSAVAIRQEGGGVTKAVGVRIGEGGAGGTADFLTGFETAGSGRIVLWETHHTTLPTGSVEWERRFASVMEMSIPDSGDGAPAVAELAPTSEACRVRCLDADGCELRLSLSAARLGQRALIRAVGEHPLRFAEAPGLIVQGGGELNLDAAEPVGQFFFDGAVWIGGL